MLSGWSRAFLLLTVATLVAYVQCYGACVAARGSIQAPASSCHHKQPSRHSDAGCQNSHAEFAGPEAGIAKAGAAVSFPVIAVPTTGRITAAFEGLDFALPVTGAPPGGSSFFDGFILRI